MWFLYIQVHSLLTQDQWIIIQSLHAVSVVYPVIDNLLSLTFTTRMLHFCCIASAGHPWQLQAKAELTEPCPSPLLVHSSVLRRTKLPQGQCDHSPEQGGRGLVEGGGERAGGTLPFQLCPAPHWTAVNKHWTHSMYVRPSDSTLYAYNCCIVYILYAKYMAVYTYMCVC